MKSKSSRTQDLVWSPSSDPIGRPSAFLRVFWSDEIALVYHSLLGNLRYAEPEIVEFFNLLEQGKTIKELRVELPDFDINAEITRLRRLGFLVSENEDELVLRKMRRKDAEYRKGEFIRALRLNVSTDCNLSCSYCYGTNDSADAPRKMSLRTAIEALQIYTRLLLENRHTQMQVRFFGGEPLINWQVVRSAMKEASVLAATNGMQLTMYLNTNGVLITPNIVDELKRYSRSLAVIVSLDGPREAHNAARKFRNGRGSFDRVLRAIDLLQKEGILVVVSATLGLHNQEYLRELVDLLVSRDIHWMGLNPIIVTEKDHLNAVEDTMVDTIEYADQIGFRISGLWDKVCARLRQGPSGVYCGGVGGELSIMPDGDIYPCQAQPFKLGTLEDVESGALFCTDAYRLIVMRTAGNLAECEGCDFEGQCAGGCAADALCYQGSIYGKTRYCDFMRAVIRHSLMKLARRELLRNDRSHPSDDEWRIWRPNNQEVCC